MIRHDHPGLFIAVEGLDGSGASIQARLLAGSLEKQGYRVVLTREPTNKIIGGLIRAHFVDEWHATPEALQLLFAADRAQHLEKTIRPALEAGRIVITDRYAYSSIAYGSLTVGDEAWLRQLNARFLLPDLAFFIKVRPKVCAIRLKESHYEVELYSEEQKLTRVWQNYEQLAKGDPDIVQVIDGERPEAEILHELRTITIDALSDHRVNVS